MIRRTSPNGEPKCATHLSAMILGVFFFSLFGIYATEILSLKHIFERKLNFRSELNIPSINYFRWILCIWSARADARWWPIVNFSLPLLCAFMACMQLSAVHSNVCRGIGTGKCGKDHDHEPWNFVSIYPDALSARSTRSPACVRKWYAWRGVAVSHRFRNDDFYFLFSILLLFRNRWK